MGIFYVSSKPSKRRRKKSKKEVAEYQEWLKNVRATSTNFSGKNVKNVRKDRNFLNTSCRRETPKINSLPDTFDPCSKPDDKVYTGNNMIGIGTLHKSNAIPIFSKEEAKDQANMRR